MQVTVNGARLFFDVAGPHLDLGGDKERSRQALLVLHGGPGYDHTGFRTYFDRFARDYLVVYLDHRGNGRSLGGAGSDPTTWTLAQWGDDIAAFCGALGLERPIVFGNSFGGMVAQAYGVRHPGHAAGIVYSSTAARMRLDDVLDAFGRLGGPEARHAATNFWTRMTDEDFKEYGRVCTPLYNYAARDAMGGRHTRYNLAVSRHFSLPAGEIWRMDFREALAAAVSPALVLTGDRDPVTPPERARELHAALPPGALYAEIAGAGHGTFRDKPDETERTLRRFFEGL